jgi:HAMP domain-containing protein
MDGTQSKFVKNPGVDAPITSLSGKKGTPVAGYIFIVMLTGFIVACGSFIFLAMRYVPGIINHQIELRNQAITTSFSSMIKKPLMLRDYLQVNREAQATSKLPGVAYAAVINSKGLVIGGFFSDLNRFDRLFAQKVKAGGFPLEIFSINRLAAGVSEANKVLNVGGQNIYDKAKAIPEIDAEVHIGIYVSEVQEAIHDALVSPLTITLISLTLVVGVILFFVLNRVITKPLEEVTDVVNRISLGEMDLDFTPRGPREIRQLGAAFERMQQSIKYMLGRIAE